MTLLTGLGGSLLKGLGGNLIKGIGGSLLGGLGQSGRPLTESQSKTTTSGNRTSSSSSEMDQFNEAIEDPEFAQFRQALLPMVMGLVDKASQPVYTDSKIASTLADINRQFSKEDINPAMAGRGLLGSGFNQQLRQDVDNQRDAMASNFFTQLPFLEQQAQLSNMGNALGMATGFAGRAPISQRVTGSSNQTGNETFDQNSTTDAWSKNPSGSGFWSGVGNTAGGWLFGSQNPFGGFGNKGQSDKNIGLGGGVWGG